MCPACNNSTHFKKHEGLCVLDERILHAFALAKQIKMPEEQKVKLRKKLLLEIHESK